MELFDGLLGGLMGGGTAAQSPLVQIALQLVQQNGGLPGLISKFEQGEVLAQALSAIGKRTA